MLSTLIDIKISLLKEPTCPQIYNCNKDTASKVCYSENTEQGIKTMTVKGCSYGEKCKIDNNMLGTCTSSSLQLLPGLYCNDNSECVSNKCEHNNCIGNKEGEKCYSDIDCHVGLYCNSSEKCTHLLKVGDTCTKDVECVSNALCAYKKCREYLSAEEGEEVQSLFQCKSLFIKSKDLKVICAGRTKRSNVTVCAPNEHTCPFTYSYGKEGTENLDIRCECSSIYSDNLICPLPTDGDKQKEAITAFKKHLSEYGPKLHTTMRLSFIDKDIDKAINYFLSFPKYYNATDCVIDYLDEPHYQLGPPIPEPTSGYTNSLNTLLLFIIVIIFLYGK